MARRTWPWDVLGIDRTSDKAAIRSAYAARLKAMDVDADVQGYGALRSARDQALREAEASALEPLAETLRDVSLEGNGLAGDTGLGPETGDFADHGTRIEHAETRLSPNAPDQRLARLLFPDGASSEDPFTYEEWQDAQAALTELLADAKSGDLGREQAIDDWLAEMLADGWPRSAPLVEPAAEAFGWLAQSGEIGERPALQFLNPRLSGQRFVAKVELRGHPLYQAWQELKRPGKRGLLDRFRVKREDIETLLGGIRTRFPEVESHLDPERVASWEKPAPSWVTWIVQRVFIFIVVLQLLAFCGRSMGDQTETPPPPLRPAHAPGELVRVR